MNHILKFLGFKQEVVKQIVEVKETKTIKDLKIKIKELADKQRYYRNQRKTKYLIGAREIDPYKAALSHVCNRYVLRDLYIAYGELKGKTIEQICPNIKYGYDIINVHKIKQEYGN